MYLRYRHNERRDVRNFLINEDGQTTVEYLLIIAVIVVVFSVLGKGFKDVLWERLVNAIKAGLEW